MMLHRDQLLDAEKQLTESQAGEKTSSWHGGNDEPAFQKDVEAHRRDSDTSTSSTTTSEITAPSNQQYQIFVYLSLSLALTFLNKYIMIDFHYPWTITAFQTTMTALVCGNMLFHSHESKHKSQLPTVSSREHLTVAIYSLLFTLNVAASNVVLDAVDLALHQAFRALCPVVTVILSFVWFRTTPSLSTLLSTVPIIIGTAMTAFSHYQITPIGAILAFVGVLLASIKTIVTHRLLTVKLKMQPMELLFRMCPLAVLQCLTFAWTTGEIQDLCKMYRFHQLSNHMLLCLCVNGAVACAFNVSSMYTNRAVGPLTMSAAANIKQSLTVIFGMAILGVQIGTVNGLGFGLTLLGAVWYGWLELVKRR